MAFRSDEAARMGLEEVEHYFTRSADFDAKQRAQSKEALRELIEEKNLGNVVDWYPSWHPLVRNHDDRNPIVWPSRECGYKGLDHTRAFVNGFITCPYNDGQEVIESVRNMKQHHLAYIQAERLDIQLYHPTATPIVVWCEWSADLLDDGTIPASMAVPLLLEKELPCYHWAQVAEPWESIHPSFLGKPHGKRSSLFVNQETGLKIKKIWESLIQTGMFGPIKE